MVPGVDLSSSGGALALAVVFPGRVLATAGLHPHDATLWPEQAEGVARLAEKAVGGGGDRARLLPQPRTAPAPDGGFPRPGATRRSAPQADRGPLPRRVRRHLRGPRRPRARRGRWCSTAGRGVPAGPGVSSSSPRRCSRSPARWRSRRGTRCDGVRRSSRRNAPWSRPILRICHRPPTEASQTSRHGWPWSGRRSLGCGAAHPRRWLTPRLPPPTACSVSGAQSRSRGGRSCSTAMGCGRSLRSDSTSWSTPTSPAASSTWWARPLIRCSRSGWEPATLSAELIAAGHRLLGYEVDARLRPLIDEVLGGDSTGRDPLRGCDAGRPERGARPGAMGDGFQSPLRDGDHACARRTAERCLPWTDFVVMVQREVAERMVAGPGDPAYGLPSVVVSLHANARIAFRVPPQVFLPATPGRFCRGGARSGGRRRGRRHCPATGRGRVSGSDARCSVSPWRASSMHPRENWRPPGSTREPRAEEVAPSSGCGSPR